VDILDFWGNNDYMSFATSDQELPAPNREGDAEGFTAMFDGKDLKGWKVLW